MQIPGPFLYLFADYSLSLQAIYPTYYINGKESIQSRSHLGTY